MEFSRPEYWSGLPFPSPGDLPDPGIEPRSLTLQADSLQTEPPGKPFLKVRFGLEISILLLSFTRLYSSNDHSLIFCQPIHLS